MAQNKQIQKQKELLESKEYLQELEKDKQQIQTYKQNFIAKVKAMTIELDSKHSYFTNQYQICYQSKCKQYYDTLFNQPKDKETFTINKHLKHSDNKQQLFIHKGNEQTANDYNECVESCQKDIRDIRFETEFQIREIDLSLNECFHFCKLDTYSILQCNLNCFRIHDELIGRVEKKLFSFYDLKQNQTQ